MWFVFGGGGSERHTFSSSISLRALFLSSSTPLLISPSSSSNPSFLFLFFPSPSPKSPPLAPFIAPLPASKSLTALSLSSASFSLSTCSASPFFLPSSFSSRWISFLCASRFCTAHSRQNTPPQRGHAQGEREGCRQRRQAPKGRKASRPRRVERVPQVERRRERSWEVKKAREVLRLEWDIFERGRWWRGGGARGR